MANIPPITLVPETLAQMGPLTLSAPMFTAFALTLCLLLFALFVRRNAGLVPSRPQVVIEMIIEYFLDVLQKAHGSEKRARLFMPLSVSIFLIVLFSNHMSLLPLVDSIFIYGENEGEKVKLFDTITSNYSMTIALALMVAATSHVTAMALRPIKHIGNYIKLRQFLSVRSPMDLLNAFIELFLGLMDIIGEFAKVISLSTRLFGNLFAGKVILLVISGLFVFTQFIFPMPFILIGVLSGTVQAFVFAMLASLFVGGTVSALELEENKN